MLKTRRNYAQLVAVAVTTLAPLVASAATSLLGASIRRFNALPRAERKRALRESLASRKATAILGPNAIVARQVAKSDTALDALLDTMEEHGVGATKAGGEIAHAAAREATRAALARTAKKNGIMSAVGRQMLTVKAPGARAYKTTVEAFIAANLGDRLTVHALKAWLRAGASKALTLYAPDGLSAYTLTLDRRKNPARPRWAQSTTVQTLIFDNLMFDEKAAKGWAKLHGYKYGKVDAKAATFRLRQVDPAGFKPKTFRTITLTEGVQAVVGVPVGSPRVNRARRNPAIRPSEEPGGKLSYDADFIAGFAAGQRTLKRKPDASYIDALKAYKRVSMKHGQLWLRGYDAAIGAARGAYAQPGVEVARLFGLVR
jgi:hypothetical protein